MNIFEIELDRTYYSKNPEIYAWCHKMFGPLGDNWSAEIAFGYQLLQFTNQEDLDAFKGHWLMR